MSVDKRPLVSIITPMYNGAAYIAECIESVIAQDYQNWKYVIVDNCSTDGSSEIAAQYAASDERITVHTNTEFLGAIENQNNSLRQLHAESKYCKVVHADDWMYPECLTRMVQVAEDDPRAGMIGSYYLRGRRVDGWGLPHGQSVFSGKEIGRDRLRGNLYLFGSPTSLLLRSDIVRANDPFYDESWTHFDVSACMNVLLDTDFGFVHQVLTYTRTHDDSLTTTVSQPAGTDTLEVLRNVVEFGPKYFESEAEYQVVYKTHLNLYYRSLARNILRLRHKPVREYHAKGLQKFGHHMKPLSVLWGLVVEIVSRPLQLIQLQVRKEQTNTWSP